MIEKVKVSLWDFYTFFMSGLLLIIVVCFQVAIFSNIKFDIFKDFTAFWAVSLVPIITILGMILEPFANKFMQVISRKENEKELSVLEIRVHELYKDTFNIEIEKPYHYIKDYCIRHDLCLTFMPFLSKFGFYRNASFIFFVSIFSFGYFSESCKIKILGAFSCFLISKLTWDRSKDFYHYQLPSLYRAFLHEVTNLEGKE